MWYSIEVQIFDEKFYLTLINRRHSCSLHRFTLISVVWELISCFECIYIRSHISLVRTLVRLTKRTNVLVSDIRPHLEITEQQAIISIYITNSAKTDCLSWDSYCFHHIVNIMLKMLMVSNPIYIYMQSAWNFVAYYNMRHKKYHLSHCILFSPGSRD